MAKKQQTQEERDGTIDCLAGWIDDKIDLGGAGVDDIRALLDTANAHLPRFAWDMTLRDIGQAIEDSEA